MVRAFPLSSRNQESPRSTPFRYVEEQNRQLGTNGTSFQRAAEYLRLQLVYWALCQRHIAEVVHAETTLECLTG